MWVAWDNQPLFPKKSANKTEFAGEILDAVMRKLLEYRQLVT